MVALRHAQPAWGARKLRRRLADLGHRALPATSTGPASSRPPPAPPPRPSPAASGPVPTSSGRWISRGTSPCTRAAVSPWAGSTSTRVTTCCWWPARGVHGAGRLAAAPGRAGQPRAGVASANAGQGGTLPPHAAGRGPGRWRVARLPAGAARLRCLAAGRPYPAPGAIPRPCRRGFTPPASRCGGPRGRDGSTTVGGRGAWAGPWLARPWACAPPRPTACSRCSFSPTASRNWTGARTPPHPNPTPEPSRPQSVHHVPAHPSTRSPVFTRRRARGFSCRATNAKMHPCQRAGFSATLRSRAAGR